MSYVGTYRQRTQNVRLLDASVRTKKRRRLRHATIGIVGFRRTGKKTLARRFNTMDQGPFEEEVPSRYYYMAYVDLDTRDTDGSGDVYLKIYVIPPPSDLDIEDPPRFCREVYNFSVLIFLCSVIDRQSFEEIGDRIRELRWELYINGMPYFLIVANKNDLNRDFYPRPLPFIHGLLTTHANFGVTYEECSARENTNVDIILEEILLRVLAEQP